MFRIKNFFKQLKRVYDFLPIIWKSYDYDYHYAVELFSFQLNRTANFFESDGAYSCRSADNAKRLRTITKLFDRAYNDYYYLELYDMMEKVYGNRKLEFEKLEDGMYSLKDFVWENAQDEKHNKAINQVFSQMTELAEEKTNKAHELAWKLVAHNIRNCWD